MQSQNLLIFPCFYFFISKIPLNFLFVLLHSAIFSASVRNDHTLKSRIAWRMDKKSMTVETKKANSTPSKKKLKDSYLRKQIDLSQ